MKHLDILLPFGLPPIATAPALIREVQAPALATLLSRTGRAPTNHPAPGQRAIDPFARALAHEAWLAQRFKLTAHGSGDGNDNSNDNSPAAALAAMSAAGLLKDKDKGDTADTGYWFILHPTHIHVARDHLVLTGMRQLTLDPADARALFDSAQPLFAEIGKTLLFGSADTWFMRADDWADLRTATPDAASGRNIDIWMPQGASGRAWRKLQNEIQMHWFTDPVNEKREAAGLKPVNSLWLWGGAQQIQAVQPAHQQQFLYDAAFNLSGWMQLFGQFAGVSLPNADVAQLLDTSGESGLLLLGALIEPGLTNEWTYWLERIETLEQQWFEPLLAALRAGKLNSIRLILTGQDRLTETVASRASLRKFWIKPTLQRLAA